MKFPAIILAAILCSGCAVVTYDRPPIHVAVVHFAMDAKADRGIVRLPDGATLDLSGASSNPNAATVRAISGAILRAALAVMGVPAVPL